MKTSIDNLANEIVKELQEYSDETLKKINEAGKKTASYAIKEIKAASPVRTGAYKKGWRQKVERNYKGRDKYTIYNEKHYRLTHLLENGHAKRNGGRVEAKPHIKQIEKKAAQEYERLVREALNSD